MVADGDHEELIDGMLFEWQKKLLVSHNCPTAQIAAIVHIRWESLGFEPITQINSPTNSRVAARIRTGFFDPGLQYELVLNMAAPRGAVLVTRHVLDEVSGKWLPGPGSQCTMAGSVFTWADRGLKLHQQELQRNRGESAKSRLKRIRAFEDSVAKTFDKLHRNS